ncbi:hypothetical protein D3C72_1509390 [compost metagenome]
MQVVRIDVAARLQAVGRGNQGQAGLLVHPAPGRQFQCQLDDHAVDRRAHGQARTLALQSGNAVALQLDFACQRQRLGKILAVGAATIQPFVQQPLALARGRQLLFDL